MRMQFRIACLPGCMGAGAADRATVCLRALQDNPQPRNADAQLAHAEADYEAAQQDLIAPMAPRYCDVLEGQAALQTETATPPSSDRQVNAARFQPVGRQAILVKPPTRRLGVQTRANFSRSRYDYRINVFKLQQAAGILSELSLNNVNTLLRDSPSPVP